MILIVRDRKTGKNRKVELRKNEFLGIVGDHINSEEFVVEIYDKEVKKVKPYLEVKVVKVKKGTSYMCIEKKLCKGCIIYQRCLKQREISKQPKGNWVNGENLDKIKFPCFCSWNYLNPTMFFKGIISKNKDWYSLINIEKQDTSSSFVGSDISLGSLIKDYNIKILRAKLILFEEE